MKNELKNDEKSKFKDKILIFWILILKCFKFSLKYFETNRAGKKNLEATCCKVHDLSNEMLRLVMNYVNELKKIV